MQSAEPKPDNLKCRIGHARQGEGFNWNTGKIEFKQDETTHMHTNSTPHIHMYTHL